MNRLSLLLGLSTAALLACNPDEEAIQRGPSPNHLQRFNSCAELKEQLVDAYVEYLVTMLYDGYGYYEVPAEGGVTEDTNTSTDASGAGSGAPRDYSSTNVQEAGVDEADLVKTDGNYLYIVQQDELTIVKSWPVAEAGVVAHLELGGWGSGLYLRGDTVVVFSTVYDGNYEGAYANGTTRASIIDVSDRANPTIRRELDLSGYLASSRLIDGDLYLVQNSYGLFPEALYTAVEGVQGELPNPEDLWDASDEAREAAKVAARTRLVPVVAAALEDIPASDFLLQVKDHAPGEEVDPAAAVACTDVYRTDSLSWPSTLSVLRLNLDEEAGALGGEAVLADGWTVYADTDSLTIAQASWSWWSSEDSATTQLHQFDLSGGDPAYVASGAIDGWILGQYSMSAYNGYLRVASSVPDWTGGGDVAVGTDVADAPPAEPGSDTGGASGGTTGSTGARTVAPKSEPGNRVSVLGRDGDDLVVVGQVSGIAPTETIYAVRMMEDKGYVVTYEQTDPLFTLDLSDPTAPAVVGELVMPGYSAYLHPIDATHLLGVGMGGDADGNVTGAVVSLFDVSDFAHPVLADQVDLSGGGDWSYSEALWDPHAFTLYDGVLALPVYTDSYDESTGAYTYFSGLRVLHAAADGLAELGAVDHADLVAQSECLYTDYGYAGEGDVVTSSGGGSTGSVDVPDSGAPTDADPTTTTDWCSDSYYWYATVRRSVIIEGLLYSISDYGVKITAAADPADLQATVLFWPKAAE